MKPETRNPNPGTRSPKPGTRNSKFESQNPEPQPRSTEPGTRTSQPETRNPKPEIRNHHRKPGKGAAEQGNMSEDDIMKKFSDQLQVGVPRTSAKLISHNVF